MSETQTTISPAPERQYHKVCPECGGPLTPVPAGSICMACAGGGKGMIYAPLRPQHKRLCRRMEDNVGYPQATRTGLLLNKTEAVAAQCYRDDVWAIDGLPGLYVRLTASYATAAGAVRARTEEHRLWVFDRWSATRALLAAVDRELCTPTSEADPDGPDHDDRKDDPLESPE